jgi:hypothetical protein
MHLIEVTSDICCMPSALQSTIIVLGNPGVLDDESPVAAQGLSSLHEARSVDSALESSRLAVMTNLLALLISID